MQSYASLGHTGEVLTLDDPAAPYLQSTGFTVYALGPVSTVYGRTPALIPWLRDNRHLYDGFVVHGLWQHTGFAAWRALAGRKPYVVFTHGMLDPYFKHASPLKHLKKWLYWLPAEYWVLRKASRVLFTSQVEMEDAKKSFWLHRWQPQVVPYGASAPAGNPADYRAAFLAHFPQLEGKRFLLFLGRIHPKKGCDLLLDAFARIAGQDPGLHLVFA